MLLSLALLFLSSLLLSAVFKKLRLPPLLGMLLVGITLGPYLLGVLDPNLLNISAELRKIALIIILMRAGLSLDIQALRQVGRPAILLCFLPACFEIGGVLLLAPRLLALSFSESLVLGCVLAAVSPAVVVPRMLRLISEKRGCEKSIPQMIMAASSVDDVVVIVLFSAALALCEGGSFSAWNLFTIPSSILLGIPGGMVVGLLLAALIRRKRLSAPVTVLLLFSLSFLFVALENAIGAAVGFSAMLAVMTLGATLYTCNRSECAPLSKSFAALWCGAEILLFVLVGATVDPAVALQAGFPAVLLILGALVCRSLGVLCALIKTTLCAKERLFCVFSYLPKATVQAAIGGIPLAAGLSCGAVVLTVAVLAILITAPLGAILIDCTQRRLLKDDMHNNNK